MWTDHSESAYRVPPRVNAALEAVPAPGPDAADAKSPQAGRLFLFGGDNGLSPLGDLWVYDVSTKKWEEPVGLRGTAPSPRSRHSLTLVRCRRIETQLEEDRLVEIEHQNRKLLQNLSKISERKGVEGVEERSPKKPLRRGDAPGARGKSLNLLNRQRELDRIERENAAILKRIQEQNNKDSEFSVAKMERDWKEVKEHRKMCRQWIG